MRPEPPPTALLSSRAWNTSTPVTFCWCGALTDPGDLLLVLAVTPGPRPAPMARPASELRVHWFTGAQVAGATRMHQTC